MTPIVEVTKSLEFTQIKDRKEIDPVQLKDFIKKFDRIWTYEKSPQEVVDQLFKIVPAGLELQELVNLIFEHRRQREIPLFLDAISLHDPSFTFSPYDKIRRAIVEDKEHLLNNSSLIAMLKEHGLDQDHEKLSACYDLAYQMNHPYIYPLAKTPVLTGEYTLNFLWVNLNPQDRIQDVAQNIFGDGLDPSENAESIKDIESLRALERTEQLMDPSDLENWNKIKKSFMYRLSKWADANPSAQINLWYDSALVTQRAQIKTFEMMRAISKSRGVNLKLRDIRQLPNIKDEIEHSLHPGTNVYYRVDILKALIADHMISTSDEDAKYCVISDIDVEPMTPQQLFDQRTLDYLSSSGYVFNRMGMSNFENSFFIFNKKTKNLREIHYSSVIESTTRNIELLREHPWGVPIRPDYVQDAQLVFRQYSNFRENIEELYYRRRPRKVVNCPTSQFNFGGNFPESDHRAESFRFIGNDNVPYTSKGRNYNALNTEGKIPSLIHWKAEPLPDIVESKQENIIV